MNVYKLLSGRFRAQYYDKAYTRLCTSALMIRRQRRRSYTQSKWRRRASIRMRMG